MRKTQKLFVVLTPGVPVPRSGYSMSMEYYALGRCKRMSDIAYFSLFLVQVILSRFVNVDRLLGLFMHRFTVPRSPTGFG